MFRFGGLTPNRVPTTLFVRWVTGLVAMPGFDRYQEFPVSDDRDSNPAIAEVMAEVSPPLRDATAPLPNQRVSISVRSNVWQRARRELRMHWPLIASGSELLLLTAAVGFANAYAQRLGELPLAVLPGAAFVVVAWLGLWSLGLYQPHAELARHPARDCIRRVLFALATGALAALAIGGMDVVGALLTAFVTASAAVLLARHVLTRLLGRLSLQRRVVVLGAGRRATTLFQRLKERDREPLARSLRVVGFVPLASDAAAESGVWPVLATASLESLVRERDLDEIVVVADDRRVLPMEDLIRCRVTGVSVIELEAFHERELGKVSLDRLPPSWCVFASAFDNSALRQISKRGFDLAFLSLLVLLSWPIMLLVAAAILIESRGNGTILYSQQRVGRNGERFTLYKFRSMCPDAERDGVARWAQTGDMRVTAVGRVIRLLRLDELPQLWNVLRGEMSIVGPRPERPQFVDGFMERVPNYGLRHCVRPGLAGWAQLRFPYGASEADAVEKLGYDLYYAKFHSLRFDFAILLETADVVLFGRGAR